MNKYTVEENINFFEELYNSGLISLNVLLKFALRPLGGSLVSFIPLCKTGTGNLLLGIDVNQRR